MMPLLWMPAGAEKWRIPALAEGSMMPLLWMPADAEKWRIPALAEGSMMPLLWMPAAREWRPEWLTGNGGWEGRSEMQLGILGTWRPGMANGKGWKRRPQLATGNIGKWKPGTGGWTGLELVAGNGRGEWMQLAAGIGDSGRVGVAAACLATSW